MFFLLISVLISLHSSIAFGKVAKSPQNGPIDVAVYPFMVSVDFIGSHVCSGVIITERHVLTSHFDCAAFLTSEAFSVAVNLTGGSGTLEGIHASNVYPHPQFNPVNEDYNFAIIELEDALEFGSGIQPIDLPDSALELEVGTNLTTVAYIPGVLIHLQSFDIHLAAQERCSDDEQFICADCILTCLYDPGGALVTPDNVLLGIYTGGSTALSKYVSVAAPAVRDFITEITGV